MIAILICSALVAAISIAWAQGIEHQHELTVIGRDVRVPRAVCIPTATRRKHPGVWQ